jgi:signal peptidase I
LALATLKKVWKNEYVQTAAMIGIMIALVFGSWYGIQLVLKTQYPALAVVSESMLPTLNVGDIIIVQGVSASEIHANITTGDIVVFRDLERGTDFRIVHRAIKKEYTPNGYWITTHGDHNPAPLNETFHENQLIGRVIARVPYIGNFALFVNALGNFYYFIIIMVIAISILFSLIFDSGEKSESEQPKWKLFGKLTVDSIFLMVINALLIAFMIFNLYGSLAFWQIGREPQPGYVTIHGMFPDLQFHESYVNQAFLSNGFLTYKIDSLVSSGIRTGVATFSWAQASFLLLLLFDVWELNKRFHLGNRFKAILKT